MRLSTIVAVLVLTLGVVGCGGGDEASSDTDTVVTEETTTDDTTTDETTTETDTDTDTSGALASTECQELVNASVELSQALGAAGTSEENLEEVAALFEEYAERAPEEIRADILVLGEAYAAYADVVADVQLEPGQAPDAETIQRLQEALASIDQEEVTAASQRLSAWAEANC